MGKSLFIVLSLFMTTLFALFGASYALAQVAVPIPDNVEGATSLLGVLIEAITAGKWLVVAGLAIMIIVLAIRQYLLPKWGLSSAVLPWVNIAISVLLGLGSHLAGAFDLKTAALVVLVSSGIADQIWSLGGKYVMDWLLKAIGSEGVAKSPKKAA
jgi:hypothetical protein